MDYRRNRHSKHLMMTHIVLVVKYRKPLLRQYGTFVKGVIYKISKQNGWHILEMEVDVNHLHFLIQYPPNITISNIVRRFKQETTYYLWLNFGEDLKTWFWNGRHIFWSNGYFTASIGNASRKIIQQYIQNQG